MDSVPTMKRPYDDLATQEEKQAWAMAQYQEVSVVGDDGLTFANKTAFMIAYERMLESQKSEGERLFNDHLAQHFTYGEVGMQVSQFLSLGLKTLFDPTDEVGLGYEGHILYTAARTNLISIKLKQWLDATEAPKQVLNMGCGVDTRAYWDENLKASSMYIEVDSQSVNDSKSKVFEDLKAKGEFKDEPFCERKVISMDFSKESTKDLPTHGFSQEVPTCWILEGLIMYLTKEVNAQLLEELSGLSAKGSYLILNFLSQNPATKEEDLDAVLLAHGWTKESTMFFGQEGFNFGRYPTGKPASTIFGFLFYKKE